MIDSVYVYDLFTGVLACLDGYMNIAIEQTEEYVNGQLKNKYGDAFLRGNNGKILQYMKMCPIYRHLTSRLKGALCNFFYRPVNKQRHRALSTGNSSLEKLT